MKNQIGLDNKTEIITLNNNNKTIKEIRQITGVPKSTIHDIIKKFKNNKTLDRVGVSGRKKSLNRKKINYILNEIKINPKINLRIIKEKIENKYEKKVTIRIIRRYLNKNNIYKYVCEKNPFIIKIDMGKRI